MLTDSSCDAALLTASLGLGAGTPRASAAVVYTTAITGADRCCFTVEPMIASTYLSKAAFRVAASLDASCANGTGRSEPNTRSLAGPLYQGARVVLAKVLRVVACHPRQQALDDGGHVGDRPEHR